MAEERKSPNLAELGEVLGAGGAVKRFPEIQRLLAEVAGLRPEGEAVTYPEWAWRPEVLGETVSMFFVDADGSPVRVAAAALGAYLLGLQVCFLGEAAGKVRNQLAVAAEGLAVVLPTAYGCEPRRPRFYLAREVGDTTRPEEALKAMKRAFKGVNW